jgi:hypothetical protein
MDPPWFEVGGTSQDPARKVRQQPSDVALASWTFVAPGLRHLAHSRGGDNVVE